ncbi:Threonine/homoserine/homoserine lactone efflux protein [Actinomadura meyerae]|jgi:threonine/homoserine/homoserine lactone efflux protein|uniref:Threonine/homoserine/homoserine lactone efflux protein n=1 Tax=Actinomadura meyerae TaxID=240840 RepID=A0A239NHY6_9ACTN|nr:LysE family translocator [Actinomadura meyerae]SNT54063.1 Threonine/homoserine/homoserine lactone efflux protein [Actinomadura meyerae]
MPIEPHLLAVFTATTIVALITPGPDMLFVMGCGVRGGARAGLLATVGVITGDALYVVAAAAGLAVLLTAFPVVFTVIRIAGAAYLIYLGVQMIRRRKDGQADDLAGGGMRGRRAFLNGVVSSMANPQTFTFMVAFLPQFISPAAGPVWLQFAILGAILIVLEFLADGTVGVLAGRIGGWLRRRQAVRRRIDAATGSVFIGLGVTLAAEH